MRPLDMQSAVHYVADLLDEGYAAEHAFQMLQTRMTKSGSKLRLEKIIKEFKRVYGMDPLDYEMDILMSDPDESEPVDENLLDEFEMLMQEKLVDT